MEAAITGPPNTASRQRSSAPLPHELTSTPTLTQETSPTPSTAAPRPQPRSELPSFQSSVARDSPPRLGVHTGTGTHQAHEASCALMHPRPCFPASSRDQRASYRRGMWAGKAWLLPTEARGSHTPTRLFLLQSGVAGRPSVDTPEAGCGPGQCPCCNGLSVRKKTAHARSATSGEPLPQSTTRLWLAPGSGQDHGRGRSPSPLLREPEGRVPPHSLDTQDEPS